MGGGGALEETNPTLLLRITTDSLSLSEGGETDTLLPPPPSHSILQNIYPCVYSKCHVVPCVQSNLSSCNVFVVVAPNGQVGEDVCSCNSSPFSTSLVDSRLNATNKMADHATDETNMSGHRDLVRKGVGNVRER